jgi:subtilisin
MRIKTITSTIFSGLLLFVSCRKGPTTSSVNDSNDCVVLRATNDGQIIEGQYIVAYKKIADITTSSTARVAALSNTVLQRNGIRAASLLRTFTGGPGGIVARLSADEMKRLARDTSVSVIEQDRIVAFGACFKVVEPRLVTWNVTRVGFGDGTGKTAWIIDSGIDFTHPDLNADATRSRSFVSGQIAVSDENGHGTHVAGIIGAKNNTIGVLGVASGATLVALKVFNKDGEGTLSSIIQALSYVNANAKAGDVVNMSLGEDQASAILDQQVQNTASKGIYIAIAAGNDHKPAVQFSPGRANGPNIYTVSATDSLDNFASFSNYGNDVVDFAAPGVRILSTWTNGRYAYLSGTSMAAPHVAGLLLLKGSNIQAAGAAKNDPDGTPDPIAHN